MHGGGAHIWATPARVVPTVSIERSRALSARNPSVEFFYQKTRNFTILTHFEPGGGTETTFELAVRHFIFLTLLLFFGGDAFLWS